MINAISGDSDFHAIQFEQKFKTLDPGDRSNVLKLLKGGHDNNVDESLEFSEDARQFINSPHFKNLYEQPPAPKPEPIRPEMMMLPMMTGLMDIIRKQSGIKDEKKGALNPEFSERVGGKGGSVTGGFESKLGDAFKSGGPKALAHAHRSLINDPDYSKFLKGGK